MQFLNTIVFKGEETYSTFLIFKGVMNNKYLYKQQKVMLMIWERAIVLCHHIKTIRLLAVCIRFHACGDLMSLPHFYIVFTCWLLSVIQLIMFLYIDDICQLLV